MRERVPIHGQDDRQKGIAAQRAHQRPGEGGPFAAAETRLLALAVADQIDIEPDARVVEEEVTVDLADIDLCRLSGGDRSQGGQRVRRNARISREMIQRTQRQDAEFGRPVDESGSDGVQRPVAAACHNGLALLGQGLINRRLDLRAALDGGDGPAGGNGLDRLSVVFQPGAARSGAGMIIDDEGNGAPHGCAGGCEGNATGPRGVVRQIASHTPASITAATQSLRKCTPTTIRLVATTRTNKAAAISIAALAPTLLTRGQSHATTIP